MGQAGFAQRLRHRAHDQESWLCVGLDPDPARLPESIPKSGEGISRFCRDIVEATADSAASYKLNLAFFELFGAGGWRALDEVRRAIPATIPVIADAKRADIGNTSRAYADAILGRLGFDAITVNPYLGWDALEPFLDYAGRGVFVLAKTSNPGSGALQSLMVDGEPLFLRVAREAVALPAAADVGLVVGATHPDAVRAVRALGEDTILLVVGVGAQGAGVADAQAGANAAGDNALIGVSREILFASSGPDYAQAAGRIAQRRARETWGVGSRSG